MSIGQEPEAKPAHGADNGDEIKEVKEQCQEE